MYKYISFLSKLISYIIPQSDNLLVFTSFPDYTDNAYAIYKYIKERYSNNYRCIWLLVDKKYNNKDADAPMVYRFSLKGLWYYYRAKYVFCTHGVNTAFILHQKNKIVNLWHGMPLKTIGSLDPSSGGYNPTTADYLVATSPFFQDIMSRAFNNMNLKYVPVVGQPRNDLLFENTTFFEDYRIDRDRYSQIGIWLPTYRSAIVGDVRVDGRYQEGTISFLTEKDLEVLNTSLVENKTLLLVKLHPMDILQEYEFEHYSNILILKQKDFRGQLYPLLGNCDFLLTDYSSVWLDYEILNKPIGFVMNDIDEYKNSRGLLIDNLEELLPGPILESVEKLNKFIENPSITIKNRFDLFNIYKDNKSCQRLAEFLKL